jgi:uncharacterized protein YndB with AHSA1/START domain
MLRYPESPASYQLSREFNAPKEKLYELFLREDALVRLWNIEEIKLDVREGGKSRIRSGDNADWDFTMHHRIVAPHAHLCWDLQFDPEPDYKVRVNLWFVKLIGSCKFTLRIENFRSEDERNESRKAWEECLKRMEELVGLNVI